MGYTSFEITLVGNYIRRGDSIIEFGSQTNYTTAEQAKPPFISEWFESMGVDYTCIDLAGDNNAIKINWSYPFKFAKQFNVVTDMGSGEHSCQCEQYETVAFHEGHINSVYPKGDMDAQRGFYECWKNKHNLCKIGGLIISVNPKSGHWPSHGFSYTTENFYNGLTLLSDYTNVELGEHAACGNFIDGYNIYSVLKKWSDKFPKFEEFQTLEIYPK